MTERTWSSWTFALAASCLLAACGGGHSDTTAEVATATPEVATVTPEVAAVTLPEPASSAAAPSCAQSTAAPAAASEYDKDMVGFGPDQSNGQITSFIKFLIGSVDVRELLSRLEAATALKADAHERMTDEKFIDLIKKSYTSETPLGSEAFDLFLELMKLPRFTPVLQQNDIYVMCEEVGRYFGLPLLSEQYLTTATVSEDGAAISQPTREGPIFMHRVDLREIRSAGSEISLQQAIDLIQQEDEHVVWGEIGGEDASISRTLRSISVADVTQFKSFSLMTATDPERRLVVGTDERVTLSIFDEKTNGKMRLTLQPKVIVTEEDSSHYAIIKNGAGLWRVHKDTEVTPLLISQIPGQINTVTLSVIEVAPAP